MTMLRIHRYALYGQPFKNLTLEQLKQENAEKGLLLARAENSGCEGCYVEVAKWNDATRRYERYAFEKYFGGEHPSDEDANCFETAALFAKEINAAADWDTTDQGLIHSLPDYEEVPCSTTT